MIIVVFFDMKLAKLPKRYIIASSIPKNLKISLTVKFFLTLFEQINESFKKMVALVLFGLISDNLIFRVTLVLNFKSSMMNPPIEPCKRKKYQKIFKDMKI